MPSMQDNLPPIRFRGIPDGAAGTRETLKMMRELVREAKRMPKLRLLALRLVRGIPEKDWQAEIRACFDFVQKKIRYTLDINAIETLQAPQVTLKLKAGDCDDKAMLLAALLELLGHPCYFCAAGFDEANAYSHVFVLVDAGGEGNIVALDTTEPQPMGWGPPNPTCFLVAPIDG